MPSKKVAEEAGDTSTVGVGTYKDNPDKPSPSSVAQIQVLPDEDTHSDSKASEK